MLRRRIAGSLHWFQPDERGAKVIGDASKLQVRIKNVDGIMVAESAWEPTAEELQHLNRGGSLIIAVLGEPRLLCAYVNPPDAPPLDTTEGKTERWAAVRAAVWERMSPLSVPDAAMMLGSLWGEVIKIASKQANESIAQAFFDKFKSLSSATEVKKD
jgi:hypothetical protein